jgi:complex iron-sulfur molybdoenzyme family reductase subunit gamma
MRPGRLATLALLLAAAPAARAAEDPLAADTVQAKEVPGPLSADPSAPFWDAVAAREVVALPQRSLRLHDRKANQGLDAAPARGVKVRAAVDGKDLAVLLEWSDGTENRTGPNETDLHGDAAALQLPLRFGAGLRLPYVGMGDDEMKVAIHLLRAASDGTAVREGVASGFGTLVRADLGGAGGAMRHDAARGSWRAVFVRPLAAAGLDLRRGLVPFAVAVWDGARSERGGNKALSGWKLIRLPAPPVDAAYAAELAWGRRPGELGDPARGKQLVQGMCIACHAVGTLRVARPGLAPDLSGIGAIATPAYLRESIVDPSAVIVPGPNPAQHQDRTKAPGVVGAFPPNEGFAWFRREPAGKKVSRMPAYAALPQQDVLAMVAYLATLGAPEGGAGGKP